MTFDEVCPHCGLNVDAVAECARKGMKARYRAWAFWQRRQIWCVAAVLVAAVAVTMWSTYTVGQRQHRMLTRAQVACKIGNSESTVGRLIHGFELPARKDADGQFWVRAVEVTAYLEREKYR